ncbi:hypothetical protein KPH14_009740 [Odynerus spinipes]|uniref:Uncharacterized protein n=1 Tax=Odynerus spinipes TaxID=1348599 RepID=A0AAD9RFS3_9HYME|nr:hypothetical protein KPH14_009740 [Odynerus spinipes]
MDTNRELDIKKDNYGLVSRNRISNVEPQGKCVTDTVMFSKISLTNASEGLDEGKSILVLQETMECGSENFNVNNIHKTYSRKGQNTEHEGN